MHTSQNEIDKELEYLEKQKNVIIQERKKIMKEKSEIYFEWKKINDEKTEIKKEYLRIDEARKNLGIELAKLNNEIIEAKEKEIQMERNNLDNIRRELAELIAIEKINLEKQKNKTLI